MLSIAYARLPNGQKFPLPTTPTQWGTPVQRGTEEEERASVGRQEQEERCALFSEFWRGASPVKGRSSPSFEQKCSDRSLRKAFREVCQSKVDDADRRFNGSAQEAARFYIQAVLGQIDDLPQLSVEKSGQWSPSSPTAQDRLDATKNLDARKMLAACALECVLQKMEERFPGQVAREELETWVVDQIAEVMQEKACAYIERGVRERLRGQERQIFARGFTASPLTANLVGGRDGIEPWIQGALVECMQGLPVATPFRVSLSRSPCQERKVEEIVYPRIRATVKRFRVEVIESTRSQFIRAFRCIANGDRLRAVRDQKPLFADFLLWIGDHPELLREFASALYT